MNTHPATWLQLAELGTTYPDYQPTFDFPTRFIDATQQRLAECPVRDGILIQVGNRRGLGPVPGFLRRADALKLYELAYFAQGDILELGSYQGLSTCILSWANHNAPHPKRIVSVDLSYLRVAQTWFNLHMMALQGDVSLIRADAATAIRRLAREQRKFAFVFIDHSHAYEPVHAVCRELPAIIEQGGFYLFHDFNDPRNALAHQHDYEVYQAVTEGLDPNQCEFYGIYGCSALYRAR